MSFENIKDLVVSNLPHGSGINYDWAFENKSPQNLKNLFITANVKIAAGQITWKNIWSSYF